VHLKVNLTLGTLLFSLYINELPLHTNVNVNLFADDTVVIVKNKNMIELQKEVNQELGIIDEWMKFNRLSLNYIKTSYFVLDLKVILLHWKTFI